MTVLFRHPLAILVFGLVIQWIGAYLGHLLSRRAGLDQEDDRSEFNTILGATLTLLALIIGFTFSMAIERFDQRLDLEEAEANAIGTEYVRADFLPAADAARVRELLAAYTQARILFYRERDPVRLHQLDIETAKLQTALWQAAAEPTNAQPTPSRTAAATGMNDVLNSQGYTQAAWRNHIPAGAWGLMLLVAFASNVMLGASRRRRGPALLVILPLVLSVPLYLISDIDSPRAGLIRVEPNNLLAFAQSIAPATPSAH